MVKKKESGEVSGEFMTFVKRQFELQQKLLEKTVYDIRDLRQGQLLHDKQFDEIQQTLQGISRAVDKDAVKVIDHERRISRLEFRR
ncbi:MAG: hypothetical protein Q7S26_03370 [bacterium]|nr:hypothetical protein [bacterium]